MSIKSFEITVSLLREACGQNAYERGRRYFHQGRVLKLKELPMSADHLVISATNLGSGGSLYKQEIDIYRVDQELILEGGCSCPVGYDCKHVVAACLAAMQSRSQSGNTADRDDFGQWLTRLTAPKGGEVPAEQEKSTEFLIYSLMPEARGDSLEVSFTVVRRKRDGQFGKGRRTTLSTIPSHFTTYFSTPSFLRQEDTEIATLLKASGISRRADIFLNGAAGSLALKLMLKTGRVFWGESRVQPLVAAPPREIGLVWREEGHQFQLHFDTAEGIHLVPVDPPMFVDSHRHEAGELILPAEFDSKWLRQLTTAPPIPRKEAKRSSRWLALNHPQLPPTTHPDACRDQ